MTAKILNEERLLRKLRVLPRVARERVRDAMARSADEIVEMMERLVPQDEGDLFASIGWVWGNKAPAGTMGVASVGDPKSGLALTIFAGNGTDAFHARWVEHGTTKMAAQPFFFVSYRANRKSATRRMRSAVGTAAREIAAI